jgi:hypothetical protein
MRRRWWILTCLLSCAITTCAGSGKSGAPPGSLAAVMSGKRVLVGYGRIKPNSPRSSYAIQILCDVLRAELNVTCFNIFGSDTERNVLRSVGVEPKDMFEDWTDYMYKGQESTAYFDGIRATNVTYAIDDEGGVLKPYYWFYWEGSYKLKVYDVHVPGKPIASVGVVGGEFEWKEEQGWRKAYRNAARAFVRKLREIPAPPASSVSSPEGKKAGSP